VTDILILGETGQLARALVALKWPSGFTVRVAGRKELGSPGAPGATASSMIAEMRPALVLNAGAYTAVDRAETERALALAINAEQPRAVAEACARLQAPLVHVSTDYVFDGSLGRPYTEDDPPTPINVYGETKLAGDRHIASQPGLRWAILRTSWVFSAAEDAFPAKILARAMAGETLRVVDDQVGCPTPAASLAEAMQKIGFLLLERDGAAQGLFNYRGAQEMSWYGLATKLVDCAVKAGMKRPDLRPISSDQFPTAARRPAYSVLDCAKIRERLDIVPAEINLEIERAVRTILAR
jgi:dTDP-4-dehydrorhamnose reductase